VVDLCLFDFNRQRRGLPKMDRHGGGHSSLSVADVAALLDELGMKQYVPTFEEFAIDGLALVECEDADLIECGINHKPVRQRSLGCCCCRCRCRCCSHLLRARRTSQVELDPAIRTPLVSAPVEASQARRSDGGRGESRGAQPDLARTPGPPHCHTRRRA
jgi:hypothetical protein